MINFSKVIFFGLILVGCSARNETTPSTTLQLVDRFPDSRSSSFIGNHSDIIVKSDTIYVPDLATTTIKVYRSDGTSIRTLGRAGRGPGEFSGLHQIGWMNDNLLAADVLNRRMQFFNSEGSYAGEFPKQRAFVEFTTSDSLIFAFSPISMHNLDLTSDSLIYVYNSDGTLLNSFGSYLSFMDGLPQGLSWPRMAVKDDLLYVLFSYVPILRIYSTKGEFVREIRLNHSDYESRNAMNTSKESLANPNAPKIGFIFQELKIHDETMVYRFREVERDK